MLVCVAVVGACTRYAAMKGPFDGEAINTAFLEFVVDKADDKLNLTDSQQIELSGLVEKMLLTALEQRPQADALRKELATQMLNEELDMDAVEAIIAKRMQLYHSVLEIGKSELVAFHGTLTDEQRTELCRFIMEHGKHGWHGSK